MTSAMQQHGGIVQGARPPNRQMRLMAQARSRTSFVPREITCVLHGGEEKLCVREAAFARVEAALGTSDVSKLPLRYANMDRTQAYHEGLEISSILMRDQILHRHGVFDRATHHYALANTYPFGLHPTMFVPTLKLQASDEQLSYWLPLAESGRIIGTYCQTELGHGTFIRGLETTATFDPITDEFVIHSPTVTSTKYWPGGLGFSCSHAIVMARLIIKEKDHGVHPFMVQLRSLDDYTPMPGIELGDIGLKLGLNQTDNGYAIFKHARVPRSHLMMRHARVLRDGTYIKSPHNKLSYATMVFTRNLIIETVAFQLGQAVTIATRYSVIREQGLGQQYSSNEGAKLGETSVISYKSQQLRLFDHMAHAFALVFASQNCEQVYQDLKSKQDNGDLSTLAYGHTTTAALKAYATQIASDGAEDCRKLCGGHGYSVLSGLPDIVVTVTPTATLEGENYVMYQQAARYLVKTAAAVRRGQVVDVPMAYLVNGYQQLYPHTSQSDDTQCIAFADPSYDHVDFLSPDTQLSIFRTRAVRLIFDSEMLLQESQTSHGLSENESWNKHMMSLIAAARAHVELYTLQSFVDTLSQSRSSLSPSSHLVLSRLCSLYALSTITTPRTLSPSFLEHTSLTSGHLRKMRNVMDDILDALTPDAIGLTDSWGFTDASLASALGVWDGNVYETLMAWTRQIPINQAVQLEGGVDKLGFQKFTRPILQAKL